LTQKTAYSEVQNWSQGNY